MLLIPAIDLKDGHCVRLWQDHCFFRLLHHLAEVE